MIRIVYSGLVFTFEIRDAKIMAMLLAYMREKDARDEQNSAGQKELDKATEKLDQGSTDLANSMK